MLPGYEIDVVTKNISNVLEQSRFGYKHMAMSTKNAKFVLVLLR